MTNFYGVVGNEESALEAANRKLAKKAAKEGFVLLKNDGALPVTAQKVALYGMGARMTVKGGLGSGSVEERYSVNIEEGLINAGLTITTQSWLDDYDEEYRVTYQAYRDMVEEKIAGLTNPMQIIPLAHSFVYRFPSGRLISEEDVKESMTDTAVYVLMRQAGEGNDRKLEAGDYYLTDVERQNLKTVAASYQHTVLVINVGGMIDMGFLDEIPGIDAVVYFCQGGEEGGNALAELLTGKENFSGKLADTIPMCYEDIPFSDEFSYLNDDLKNEYYKEDIYVGYRYFDSFDKEVRYPFGYGLSYTDFHMDAKNVVVQGSHVTLTVNVNNTGERYSGKEVVQVYLSSPEGELEKEYQSLCAFAKTKELAPGEEEVLTVGFDLAGQASYLERTASWVLEQGEYLVRVGNSSRNTKVCAVLSLDRTVTVRQCKNCCEETDGFEKLHRGDRDSSGKDKQNCSQKENIAGDGGMEAETIQPEVIQITLCADDFVKEIIDYTKPSVTESAQEKEILDSLSVEEMAEFVRGGDLQKVPEGAHDIHGAGGKTVTSLLGKGIRNVVFSDGPAGVNIVNRVCYAADGTCKPVDIPERYNWGFLAKMAKERMCSSDGTIVSRYATAWPVEMLLAQTWNIELLEQIGEAVADEMLLFGVTIWLAPGMNIHRNPLGGRTFEYYSEDPVVTGMMAAALTKGVQSRDGVGTCIKHFCCNNTEDNRNGISSNVSERALREIYLKGFEIAVKTSQPKTVMSSYNQLNHVYTANRYDLLTDILRCEWGFEGLVMTDWGSCGKEAGKPQQCAPAGNDLIMPGSDWDKEEILKALSDGSMTKEDVRTSACRVLRVMLEAAVPVIVE